ncbi:MAG: RNA polymerase sigma factor, partial [Burkholderiales bacterium]
MDRAATSIAGTDDLERQRFEQFFPRLFAYAFSFVGDDAGARDVVIEAFSRAFTFDRALNDEQFPMALFAIARGMLHPEGRKGPNDGLTPREREVVALLFDARLSRREVAALMRIGDEAVTAALLRGLRKLQA